jgi:NhaA family Na+:H+ antiporter
MAHPTEPAGRPSLAQKLPRTPVERLTRPLARFLEIESASGLVLLVCTVLALTLANSPAAGWYHALWHTHVGLEVGRFKLGGELGHFLVNDVLMTVFFFVVGLEIKRELVTGELRDPRKAALPVIAALGGMLVPAGIYLALMAGKPGDRGWGIPMATDIAFVVGAMALLGPRFPFGLKVMLLSLAIADDIGAVVVIALFYSEALAGDMLALVGVGLAAVYALNRLGVRAVPVYALVGAGVWLAALHSGIHPTVAGVVLGLMTPTFPWVRREALRLALADLHGQLGPEEEGETAAHDLQLLSFAAREAISPQERLESGLHPWVGFVIMPLFALANAGVAVNVAALADPVAVAVALGLFLGKPAGIVLFSWLAVRAGVARLPDRVTWPMMLGAGCLGGIGFTMSLFVAGLALDGEHLAAGKIGTLTGSVCSAAVGAAILLWALREQRLTPPG